MNLIERLKASFTSIMDMCFCYSTLSLLGLGFINLGSASCDKPLAEVLIGYGLLFLFGLILEIAGMFRADESRPMPLKIAMGKMIFLGLCLLWTLISTICGHFSSVECRGARTWNRVGLQKRSDWHYNMDEYLLCHCFGIFIFYFIWYMCWISWLCV